MVKKLFGTLGLRQGEHSPVRGRGTRPHSKDGLAGQIRHRNNDRWALVIVCLVSFIFLGDLVVTQASAPVPSLSFSRCVILDRFLKFSGPQFLIYKLK